MIPGITASMTPTSGGVDPLGVRLYSGFKTGSYIISGVTVTVADVWVQDTNWGNFTAATSIIGGTGLSGNNTVCKPVMESGAYSVVSPGDEGFVAVFEVVVPSVTSRFYAEFLDLPGFAQEGTVEFRKDWVQVSTPDFFAGQTINAGGTLPAGSHKIAVRFTPDETTAKTDGAVTSTSFHTNASPQLNSIALGFGSVPQATPFVVEAITFYPVAADLDAVLAL